MYGKSLASIKEKVDKMYIELDTRYKNIQTKIPEELKCGYSVFYTHPLNTLKEGAIYYLGLNPGGTAKNAHKEDLSYFEEKKQGLNWCDFTAERWKNKKGEYQEVEAPLQKRVKHLLEFIMEALGEEPKIQNVFCTNLYFFRTPKAIDLRRFGDKTSYDCWEYHKCFLKTVNPKVIICNGNGEALSAYSEIRNCFKNSSAREYRKLLYGTYYLKSFFIETPDWERSKALVLGIPHMSRFNPNNLGMKKGIKCFIDKLEHYS